MYQYNFEKLEIWQKAIELSVSIYHETKDFPTEERYGLTSQIRRSCNSISANIAEGTTRTSNKDRKRFVQIGFGSAIELISHLVLANKLGFMDSRIYNELRSKINELANKINAYSKSIEKKEI
jgi:four helix bundle protein